MNSLVIWGKIVYLEIFLQKFSILFITSYLSHEICSSILRTWIMIYRMSSKNGNNITSCLQSIFYVWLTLKHLISQNLIHSSHSPASSNTRTLALAHPHQRSLTQAYCILSLKYTKVRGGLAKSYIPPPPSKLGPRSHTFFTKKGNDLLTIWHDKNEFIFYSFYVSV